MMDSIDHLIDFFPGFCFKFSFSADFKILICFLILQNKEIEVRNIIKTKSSRIGTTLSPAVPSSAGDFIACCSFFCGGLHRLLFLPRDFIACCSFCCGGLHRLLFLPRDFIACCSFFCGGLHRLLFLLRGTSSPAVPWG
jgi:hypothetical protein